MNSEPSRQEAGTSASPAADQSTTTAGAAGAPLETAALDAEQLRQVITALQDENDKLRVELDSERDQMLRARADMENIRRRGEREKADTAKYAIGKFAGDVVSVADNFDRAIKSVPEGAATDDPTLKALIEGVLMTEREFLSVLERHGIKRVTPQDEAFNPHLHQAVMQMQRTDLPEGLCVQVFQPGYTIEDRVLRPAMVAVSKGGGSAAPQPEPTTGPSASDPSGAASASSRNGGPQSDGSASA